MYFWLREDQFILLVYDVTANFLIHVQLPKMMYMLLIFQ